MKWTGGLVNWTTREELKLLVFVLRQHRYKCRHPLVEARFNDMMNEDDIDWYFGPISPYGGLPFLVIPRTKEFYTLSITCVAAAGVPREKLMQAHELIKMLNESD